MTDDKEIIEKLAQKGLTDRQIEITMLVAQGYSNQTIAFHCGITTGGVKSHLTNIFNLLDVNSRSELMFYVLRGEK